MVGETHFVDFDAHRLLVVFVSIAIYDVDTIVDGVVLAQLQTLFWKVC